MTRHAAATILLTSTLTLGLAACSGGGSAGEKAVKDAYDTCSDSAVAGEHLVRDGKTLRIVIKGDPSELDEKTQSELMDLATCVVTATGYAGPIDDLGDGDQWGRWTFTEDSDGGITFTATDEAVASTSGS